VSSLKNFLWTGLAAWALSGCATLGQKSDGRPAILIALQLAGGGAPSAQQAATVYRMLGDAVGHAGLRFADSREGADYVVTATFTPDPVDPNRGHLTVRGVERVQRPGVDLQAMNSSVQNSLSQLEAWARRHEAPDY
jgi:hypothetical protein